MSAIKNFFKTLTPPLNHAKDSTQIKKYKKCILCNTNINLLDGNSEKGQKEPFLNENFNYKDFYWLSHSALYKNCIFVHQN
jgi:hypothetical protein